MLANLQLKNTSAPLSHVANAANQVILGKSRQIQLALTCMLASGHLLIEDIPGVGKTTLAHLLAKLLGLDFQRIQFTSDLLPADILGGSLFDRENNVFIFHPGPIFSQLILADEINRASPKTQSALLEAMEEHQVTTDGQSRPLPVPFFVIATQNPTQQIGTFPLPESQLDRFLMRIELGYPDPQAERELLKGMERREMIAQLQPILNGAELAQLQKQANRVQVSDALLNYVQALIYATRDPVVYTSGLSPRAGLALLHAAKAWAFISGRDFVIPEDIQAVLGPVVNHRLRASREYSSSSNFDFGRALIQAVPIP